MHTHKVKSNMLHEILNRFFLFFCIFFSYQIKLLQTKYFVVITIVVQIPLNNRSIIWLLIG